jgi:SAM-dependent methyltransferase
MISHLSSLWDRFGQLYGAVRTNRIIIDRHRRLNHPARRQPTLDTSINKEEDSRRLLFDPATPRGRFLEIGCGEGDLSYLLGIRGNLDFDAQLHTRNLELFRDKFDYCGIDLAERSGKKIVAGDVCSPDFPDRHPDLLNRCAVVYSNNVFEHLRQPWIAARNIGKLIATRGVCITVVPFAQRYHESPGDYFRYTHKGLESLFESVMRIEVIRSGYDILGRRNDWQGSGDFNDSVPVDEFGAWRETWFTFLAFRKIGEL